MAGDNRYTKSDTPNKASAPSNTSTSAARMSTQQTNMRSANSRSGNTAMGDGEPPSDEDEYKYLDLLESTSSSLSDDELGRETLRAVTMSTSPEYTLLQRVNMYIDAWHAAMATIPPSATPSQYVCAKILIAQVSHDGLRSTIMAAAETGEPPGRARTSKRKTWRKRARYDIEIAKKLIREFAEYWDNICMGNKRISTARSIAARDYHTLTPAQMLINVNWADLEHFSQMQRVSDFCSRWETTLQHIPKHRWPSQTIQARIWLSKLPRKLRTHILTAIITGKQINRNDIADWRKTARKKMQHMRALTVECAIAQDNIAAAKVTKHDMVQRMKEQRAELRLEHDRKLLHQARKKETQKQNNKKNKGNDERTQTSNGSGNDSEATDVYIENNVCIGNNTNRENGDEDSDITEVHAGGDDHPTCNAGDNDETQLYLDTNANQDSKQSKSNGGWDVVPLNSDTRTAKFAWPSNLQPDSPDEPYSTDDEDHPMFKVPVSTAQQINNTTDNYDGNSNSSSMQQMRIQTKYTSILTANEDYILHQCNCISTTAAGLAKQIFKKFPHANTYAARPNIRQMGEISLHQQQQNSPTIVNIYGQYRPGKPTAYGGDSPRNRQQSFESALRHLSGYIACKHTGIVTIAVPWRIACGLAQGHWPTYQNLIEKFQTKTTCMHRMIHITYYRYTPATSNQRSAYHDVPNSAPASTRRSQKWRSPTQSMVNTENQMQHNASEADNEHKYKRKRR